jgi:hypothetical protein
MNQRLDFQFVAKMLAKKKRSLSGFTGSSGLRVDPASQTVFTGPIASPIFNSSGPARALITRDTGQPVKSGQV